MKTRFITPLLVTLISFMSTTAMSEDHLSTDRKNTINPVLREDVMKIKVPGKQAESITEAEHAKVIAAVKIASNIWKDAFNRGNAAAAANQYESNAVMTAQPFGTFNGRQDIQVFWQNLIAQGFAEVQYIEPTIEVISADSAIVSSQWKMNKAHGVITKELWVLQSDGQAKLRIDNFEVLGE